MAANIWIVVVTCILATCAVVVNCDNEPSLAPASDCSTIIYNMADCISFLSNGSKENKPDESCCSGFKSVLETDPSCICEALQNSAQLGIELNLTKAMTLPSACGLSAPPLSKCGLPVAPGASPVNPPKSPPKRAPVPPKAKSPAPAPPTVEPPTVEPQTPTVSPSTGGGSAAQVPAPSPSASGAYSTCASFAATVIVMLVASILA